MSSADRLRPLTPADLPLLRRWRAQPHVVEHRGAPEVEDEAETLADPRVAMWIVAHAGRRWCRPGLTGPAAAG